MTIKERIRQANLKRHDAHRNNSIQGIVYWDGYIDALKDIPDGWISVEDELPLKSGRYITVCKGLKTPVVRKFAGTFVSLQEVTHWMPLPGMPRKGANNEQRKAD